MSSSFEEEGAGSDHFWGLFKDPYRLCLVSTALSERQPGACYLPDSAYPTVASHHFFLWFQSQETDVTHGPKSK